MDRTEDNKIKANINETKNNSSLSKLALAFLIIRFAIIGSYSIGYLNYGRLLSFINNIPWLSLSMVLAIISRIKNKDKLSKTIIIIDIVIFIIGLMLAFVMFVIFIKGTMAFLEYFKTIDFSGCA